ncbi:MAG: hypothetical protein AAF581_11120 [Planctomycetota bacterium]
MTLSLYNPDDLGDMVDHAANEMRAKLDRAEQPCIVCKKVSAHGSAEWGHSGPSVPCCSQECVAQFEVK